LAHWETKYVIEGSFTLTIQLQSKCTRNHHTATVDSQTWQMRKMQKYPGPSTDSLIQSIAGGRLMLNMTHHDDNEEERHGYIGILNVVVNANQTG
jgi:hypothetical protein